MAATLHTGQAVALTNTAGEIVATLDITDVFEWDKPKYLKSVHLTERTDHPGGHMTMKDERKFLVGGNVWVKPQPKHPEYGNYVLTPRETRALFAQKRARRSRRQGGTLST